MAKKFQRWIAGRIAFQTENAVLIDCFKSDARHWVPKYAIAHVRNAVSQDGLIGVVVLSINKKFKELGKFKALKPDEVQSLLYGDALREN